MMKRIALLLALALATAAAPLLAASVDTGEIKVCRRPGLYEMMDHRNVVIPKGARFVNTGDTVHVAVTTTKRAVLGPKPDCARVKARITTGKHPAGVLVAAFSTPGATLQATIAGGFR